MATRFVEDESLESRPVSAELHAEAQAVGASIAAYRNAAVDLLSTQYKDFAHLAPLHLQAKSGVTVVCCTNGVIVRYERPSEEAPKVRAGAVSGTLEEYAPAMSEGFVHFPSDPPSYVPGPGPTIHFVKKNFSTNEETVVRTMQPVLYASPGYPLGLEMKPPRRPIPLVSLTNRIEIVMEGDVVSAVKDEKSVERPRPFVARGSAALQVGWQGIEVYPRLGPEIWKPVFAPLWAESDVHAAIARAQLRDTQFFALDPNVSARNHFRQLLEELGSLLNGPEEPAHQFLKSHPELLSPAHSKYWSKLPLGDRVTDFVFRSPTNEYLLVELESPLREVFRKDGQQRQELTHAFDQILDWRAYIENNLAVVQSSSGLAGMSVNPESLIVIGRSVGLTAENRAKLTTMQNQIPRLRILTYDDLILNAKAVAENLFGPLDLIGDNIQIHYLARPA